MSHHSKSIPRSQSFGSPQYSSHLGLEDAANASPSTAFRTLDISALRVDGSLLFEQVKVPVGKVFDDAFAAFAQGTLIQTPDGQTAVEDLSPGQYVQTSDGLAARINWISSSSIVPASPTARMPLTRVMGDAFGPGRPNAFVTVGPAARILKTPSDLRASEIGAPMLSRMGHFVDGLNVIEVAPPTPVQLFHIGLERHSLLIVGGLQMESYHPNTKAALALPRATAQLFLSLFPRANRLSDFGSLSYLRVPDGSFDQSAA